MADPRADALPEPAMGLVSLTIEPGATAVHPVTPPHALVVDVATKVILGIT